MTHQPRTGDRESPQRPRSLPHVAIEPGARSPYESERANAQSTESSRSTGQTSRHEPVPATTSPSNCANRASAGPMSVTSSEPAPTPRALPPPAHAPAATHRPRPSSHEHPAVLDDYPRRLIPIDDLIAAGLRPGTPTPPDPAPPGMPQEHNDNAPGRLSRQH